MREYPAGHNRTGQIWLEQEECDVCGEYKVCIAIDSSEEEYGPGHICQACAEQMFQENNTEERVLPEDR